MTTYAIAIHGGAGTISRSSMTPEKEAQYRKGLEESLQAGHAILKEGGTALDAVERAVQVLEDNPLFNAGKGSVFSNKGKNEMDASIMCGKTLKAGAVAAVTNVKNPISLTRSIMEKTENVFLLGQEAVSFAKKEGLAIEPDEYFFTQHRYDQWQEIKESGKMQLDHSESSKHRKGTVGAVALDKNSNLAAATSTGGMTNKQYGRIGDSCIIGAGTYANNNTCAISCTGNGEFFIRAIAAYDVSCLMEYKGLSLEEACRIVVHDKLVKQGDGGLIAVDAKGNIAMPFNSKGMYRGMRRAEEEAVISIYKD